MRILGWTLFIFFAVGVGLYPILYLLVDMKQGFLGSKPAELLQRYPWQFAFYTHIFFGGIALLTGWSQFSKKLRNRYLDFHRTLGKVYVIVVTISGVTGLYIALFANGGLISILGFSGLAIAWLFTTTQAYLAIRKKDITQHEEWMIRSYAVTFAAVTLRIWLPFSQAVLAMDFIVAYRIIAWLCWVPNLLVAEWIVRSRKLKLA
jgi:uncharacterized membrane protein